jgi:hypothetical protein
VEQTLTLPVSGQDVNNGEWVLDEFDDVFDDDDKEEIFGEQGRLPIINASSGRMPAATAMSQLPLLVQAFVLNCSYV